MRPLTYSVILPDGVESVPLTARQIAEAVQLPLGVVTKRLQRGERRVDALNEPVRAYGLNGGVRALSSYDKVCARREIALDLRDNGPTDLPPLDAYSLSE